MINRPITNKTSKYGKLNNYISEFMVNPNILLLTPAQPNRAISIQTTNYEQLFIVAISEKVHFKFELLDE